MEQREPTIAWRRYEDGKNHHTRIGLYKATEQAHRFYEGDQWNGLQSGGEPMPCYNFIRPTVNYRAASVAMNNMRIVYNPIEASEDGEAVCNALNRMAEKQWERTKMDKVSWEVIKEACISGESYLYFSDRGKNVKVVQTTDIYFGDETSPDIQKQPYIIIRERRFVEDVRQEAKKNGISPDKIEDILPDDIGEGSTQNEKDGEGDQDRKCTCLLMLTKKDGYVHMQRSTRTVVYHPDRAISETWSREDGSTSTYGMTKYPLVSLVWNRKHDSSRGTGECKPLIPNQIETNKTLVRRLLSVKMCAYAKPVYAQNAVQNPDALAEAGTAIEVDGMTDDVRKMVTYLSPASMSSDAHLLAGELVDKTRELAGAGDAATGQIDPTKTSGAAIIAARDQSAIPLNEQTAFYRQTVEDIAMVWLDLWAAYNPQGIQTDDIVIPADRLRDTEMMIRVDVTPTDPYSKYAAEQSLENAMMNEKITFEEYVDALPDDAAAPKAKFMEIVEERRKALEPQMMMGGTPQLETSVNQLPAEMAGGVPSAMPQM